MKRVPQKNGLMGPPLWWGAFLGATFVLSLCFQAFKDFTLVPNLPNGLALLGMLALLVAIMLALVLDSYLKERAKGKIERPVALFERLFPPAEPQGETHP